ncbi:MAG TPA: iron ABC transporter permease, partial [Euryarchaeota archaeon]|nr:iron ABC transporter permease [Euryarchaeota archaeon]
MHSSRRFTNWRLTIALLLFILLVVLLLSVSIGPAKIRVQTIFQILLSRLPLFPVSQGQGAPESAEVIILLLRLPRAIQAALIGASLAVSGVVIQSLFKNPMADPYVVGISSGAALGASTA